MPVTELDLTGNPLLPHPFVLEPLSRGTVDAAVRLHQSTLSYSLNSRLGAANLSFLYSLFQQEAGCLAVVAVSEKDVLGLVSAVLDPDRFKRRIFVSTPFWRWIFLAGRVLSGPDIWLEWLRSRSVERPVIFKGEQVKPCLTTLSVAPAARRSGVGRALVAAVDAFVGKNGYPCYHLNSRAQNSAAHAFYCRMGFVELEQRGRDVVYVREL